MPGKTKISINGMSCVSCESVIKTGLKEIDGVNSANVCHKTQTAVIFHSSSDISLKVINLKLKELGYGLSYNNRDETNKTKKASTSQWFLAIFIVICLYGVYKYFEWLGVLNFINIDPQNVGYGAAFLVGIVASLSTCLAVIGAVVISFGAKYQTSGSSFQRNVKPHLLFHVGRLVSFFLLGGLLGTLGGFFVLSSSTMGWFTIIVAVILAWLGLNILGILPPLSKVGFHMPKKFSSYWERIKQSEHSLSPALLGAFTFFLPCGFTTSMQLFAISSGSFWTGALTLTLFAIGTLPILLGLGITSSRARTKKRVVLQKVIGFVIIAFSWYTLSSGLAIAGVSLDAKSNQPNVENEVIDGLQVIKMDVDYRGYSPSSFNLKKGIPVRWEIDVKQLSGCTNEIIVPELNIRKKLVSGKNIVEFTPTTSGTVGFSCWMGMVRGKFIIK